MLSRRLFMLREVGRIKLGMWSGLVWPRLCIVLLFGRAGAIGCIGARCVILTLGSGNLGLEMLEVHWG